MFVLCRAASHQYETIEQRDYSYNVQCLGDNLQLLYTSTLARIDQDPREFSDDGSEDSGFEESVSPTDHTKEQRLKNDKYDMALEVRQVNRERLTPRVGQPLYMPGGVGGNFEVSLRAGYPIDRHYLLCAYEVNIHLRRCFVLIRFSA